MIKLRPPLVRELEARVDEATLQRIWGRIGARRAGSRPAPRSTRAWSWAVVSAALLVVLAVVAVRWQGLRPNHAPGLVSAGVLTSRAGKALSVLGEASASTHELSDGSTIALEPGSRLEVLENDSRTFVSVLRRGRGRFSVRPGGPRRWIVETGLATVEVVGTQFSIARLERGVLVQVHHGTVLVRSHQLQDDVQRLTAGQEILVSVPAAVPRADSEPVPVPPLPAAPPASAKPNNAVTLDALLARATEQRRRGDSRGAESSLRQALAEHSTEPQAALAAFSLGKLLDTEGRSAEAARTFARCLSLSPPQSLAEDAWFRLAEAHAKSGNAAGAATAAREYRARYPAGRHARDVARWLEEH